MASHREERQSARSGLRSEGEHLGEGSALEGADPSPCPRVHPALCTWPSAPPAALRARDGRERPVALFCLLLLQRLCFLFLLFCFRFGLFAF